MESNKKYLEETEQFINDILQGKYSEPSCHILQWQELRYDYSIVEDVYSPGECVILFGLSH